MARSRALLASGAAVLALSSCEPAEPELPDFWIPDLDRGVEVAAETGRPMLVVFR
jgi:hypothetical protein